jgi:acyl dehydratase
LGVLKVRVFETLESVLAHVGQEVAQSEWVQISQERIDGFANATEDHQWIHTDPVRASHGPFKTTIAHGFLTLSMVPKLFEQSIEFQWRSMGINYGLNKVRFTGTVPVESRIRATFTLLGASIIEEPRGLQTTWHVELTREGVDKPVCVAESVLRHYV